VNIVEQHNLHNSTRDPKYSEQIVNYSLEYCMYSGFEYW